MVSQTAHHSVAPAVFRDVLQRLTSDCICMGFIFVAVVNLVKASGAYTLTPAFAEFFGDRLSCVTLFATADAGI